MPRDTAAEQTDARVCGAADERGTRTAGHTCLHRTTFWSIKNQRAMIQRASSLTAGCQSTLKLTTMALEYVKNGFGLLSSSLKQSGDASGSCFYRLHTETLNSEHEMWRSSPPDLHRSHTSERRLKEGSVRTFAGCLSAVALTVQTDGSHFKVRSSSTFEKSIARLRTR